MKEIFTETTIAAPARTVWEILTDLENFKNWNPFILYSHGTVAVGEIIECNPRLPGSKKVHHFKPVVTHAHAPRTFAWLGHTLVPGIADGEHIFELFDLPDGGTRLVHRQNFWGVLIPLIWPAMNGPTKKGFERMNQALKEQAEKREQGQ